MTMKTKILALTTATAVAAGSMVPLAAATPANASGLYDGNRSGVTLVDRRYKKRGFRNRGHLHGPRYHNPRWNRGHAYKKKDRTGKYLAIGLGALMLGIIASEASRSHHSYDHRYDY